MTSLLVLLLAGCPADPTPVASSSGGPGGPASQGGGGAGDPALGQDRLREDPNAVKLEGTFAVEGYTKGRLQVDVFAAGDATKGRGPLTSVPFEGPGPYVLYLPASVGQVDLVAMVDVDSDGPNAGDLVKAHPDNPISVKPTTGVDFQFTPADVRGLPPTAAGEGAPPWQEGQGSPPAPEGSPTPAPPGSPEPAPEEGGAPPAPAGG